ncbi:polysaccharide biosynthesis protein [Flavisphingomonas formosensis]|uniref:polysaccharide biosynthesis protein n=1 Tax=Flavisphingomonas formosensis TaxID=861534 RepID=UPI0012FA1AE6|nr:nucleoside-diphosphate sugar epimerase/dehydratase [Sphingomonas formosensis]
MTAPFTPIAGRRSWRRRAFLLYDSIAICLALTIAVLLRMNGQIPQPMLLGMICSLPIFLACGLVIFHLCGVYERVWRLGSLNDLIALVGAAAISVIVPVAAITLAGARWLPTSVPFIQWFVLVAILAGGRLWRRILADQLRSMRRLHATDQSPAEPERQRALIVGSPENVEMVLRQLEAADDPDYVAVGILDLGEQDVALRLRRVPILGSIDAVAEVVSTLAAMHLRPHCLILAEGTTRLAGPIKLKLVTAAETLGLAVMRAPKPTAMGEPLGLKAVNHAELLGRPQTTLDPTVVSRALEGCRVLVTGAGGTIGRELVRQIAAFGPAELILLDAGEFNLYSVELEMRENFPGIPCSPVLCSIRQRQHIMDVFSRYRPEFVLHAAALKHVPLVETNICAGVMTNVLGTRNVADAALRFGARAMVQVSTDKAVNPVGIMGATKRLGELYCQALDLAGSNQPSAPRFMTVRFGNVLGSSGSLIPLFEHQLKRRAPLTVTHPEITRFFMTVHEAVQLVLHSMARTLGCDVKRGRIIVLDMGEPVKIIDIARRMIRLSGLEPDVDVQIKIVGLRPGEKLYEELFDEREERLPSALPGVFEAEPVPVPVAVLNKRFDAFARAIADHDEQAVHDLLFQAMESEHRGDVVPLQIIRSPQPVSQPVRTMAMPAAAAME